MTLQSNNNACLILRMSRKLLNAEGFYIIIRCYYFRKRVIAYEDP